MKDKIKKFDSEVKEEQAKLVALRAELKDTSEAVLRRQLDKELADRTAELQAKTAETRKQFLAEGPGVEISDAELASVRAKRDAVASRPRHPRRRWPSGI